MANFLSHVARGLTQLPRRLLAAAGWAQMEPTGFGVGPTQPRELDEMETERRQERETWRKTDDEGPPANS